MLASTRDRFVERFGETDALNIEAAARQHRGEKNRGDNPMEPIRSLLGGGDMPQNAEDQFLLDIAWCITYECVTRFHSHHGFVHSVEDLQEWISNNASPPHEYREPGSPHYAPYLGEM